MEGLLLLGLLVGMRHALDADHLAAVATLVTRGDSLRSALRQGSAWGLGHTITLMLFGSLVIFLDHLMPEMLVKLLETAVGLMLILLGVDLLRRLVRDRIHFHVHRHGDTRHFHAHSHKNESAESHDPEHHTHHHPTGFPLRALLVGLMHGMAGSAAVILLALDSVESPLQGMVYILVFGLGSMLGMALLSVVISIPLRLTAGRLTWLHNGIQLVVALLTLSLGILVIHHNGAALIG